MATGHTFLKQQKQKSQTLKENVGKYVTLYIICQKNPNQPLQTLRTQSNTKIDFLYQWFDDDDDDVVDDDCGDGDDNDDDDDNNAEDQDILTV